MVVKVNCHGGKNQFLCWHKSISKVVKAISTAVKINFYCGKNQYPRW